MKKELEIWQFAAEKLERGQSAVLLVVAESAGSSPGRQGFKMIVAADDIKGSVGGGAMEMRLVEAAKLKIQTEQSKNPALVEQVHRENSQTPSGMICSGRQTIIFRKLTTDDLRTVQNIVRYIKNNRLRYLQITESKFQTGWHKRCDFDFSFTVNNPNALEAFVREVPGEELSKTIGEDAVTEIDASEIRTFLYEEKLGFKNKLSIVGGGHCALALAELMSKMDFYIEIFDDRAGLNTLEKNRFAHRKQIVASYENIGDFIDSNARNHFVVVMTVGYKSDEIAIRKLLDKDFKYFGVLGSRAKIKTLLKNLEREGFDRERLNRIRAPVGLEINSRTPEEIAVSIAAEIIAVKNAASAARGRNFL